VRVPESAGTPEPVTQLDRSRGEISHRWPQVLPGNRAILFTVWTGPGWDEKRVELQILATGERRVVAEGASTGRYVTSGHVVYSRAGKLMAVPFDLDRLEAGNRPPVILSEQLNETEGAPYTVSGSGVLAYVPGNPAFYERRLVWVDRDGGVEPLPGAPLRSYESVDISADGRALAYQSDESGRTEIHVRPFTEPGARVIISTEAGQIPSGRATAPNCST
jgi:serine/threonine-protein kinase